jgi:cobalt-zinc-cadmium resistance protein CzcA
VVLVAWGGIVVAGLVAFARLPLDAFPDTTPVQVQINTVAPALAPLEIERQITFPIEQALSGLPHLHEVRSLSKFGLSQVTVLFADGTDIYFARQVAMDAADRRAGAKSRPLGPSPLDWGRFPL